MHTAHRCARCRHAAPPGRPAIADGRALIDGYLYCDNCYTQDDTGRLHPLRDNFVYVYLDERIHNPDEGIDGHAAVYDGWNLADAPADFDSLDFHTAYWGAINNVAHDEERHTNATPNLTGIWKITYDRTGTVHNAERLTPAGHYA